MLTLRSVRTPTRIETADLKAALLRLSDGAWKPAVLESMRSLAKLAGASSEAIAELGGISAMSRRGYGDLVFDQDCIHYVISGLGESGFIEAGVVRTGDNSVDKLAEFVSDLEKTIMVALDGRKTRHMRFEWQEVSRSSDRLEKIIAAEQEQAGVELQRAKLAEEECAAAIVLEARPARTTLIEIAQAGFAREQDILSRRGKARDEAKAALEEVKRGGLVAVEYLVECRKSSTPVTRLQSPDDLHDPAIARLKCPGCGRTFPEETLSEAYSLSELGKRMIQKSHWMTISVTRALVKIGVPIESILWNVSEAGEEVDLVVDVLGDLWLFELKDREFGSGDAHPFNYRQVRYKSAKAVVVTTERVSVDAKRVFQELAKESRGQRQTPTYVEGLENIYAVLTREVETSYRGQAGRKLLEAGALSGLDLRPLLKARLGEIPERQRELTGLALTEEMLRTWSRQGA